MNPQFGNQRAMTRLVRHAAIALALVSCVPSSLPAQLSTWEPMNRGLLHRLVYTIAIDPVDSLVMYCGTEYGNLYKSYDGGFNWVMHRNGIPSNYNGEQVTALYLDPEDRRKLYCGFGGRQSKQNLFRSGDSAATWSVVPTPEEWLGGGVLNIYQTGTVEQTMYCGLGWYNGIWVSRDSGITWSKKLNNLGIQVIAGHAAAPRTLFAGSSSVRSGQGPILCTQDGGANWSSCANSGSGWNSSTGVRAIAVAPGDTSHVYIGVTGSGEGLYRSVSNGTTGSWEKLIALHDISEIAIHPRNEKLIYLSTVFNGVMRSTDGGTTWTSIKDGLPAVPIMRVRIAPGYPVRVFAVTLKEGIYRLVDEELPESFVR